MRCKKEQKYMKEWEASRLIRYKSNQMLLPYVRIHPPPQHGHQLRISGGLGLPFHLKFFQGNEAHYPEGSTISIMSFTSSKAESLPSSNWMNL